MSTDTFCQSEQRFHTLIQHSMEAIALFSPDGTVLYASPSTERVIGYTADEFVGMNIFSLVHPNDLEGVQERLANLLEQPGTFTTLEYRLRHQDGTFRWIEGIVSNCLAAPDIGAIVSNYHDITGHKQTEAERDQALAQQTLVQNDITEQRRLERRTHEVLDALLAIAEVLVTVPPESEVATALLTTTTLAHRLLELTCRVMGCENATFVSRELDTDVAHLVASVGFTSEQERLIRANVEGTRFADRYQDPAFLARLHAGEVQLLDLSRPPYRDRRPLPGLRQAMVVPIRLGEILVGVISLNHVDALYEYTAADLALAQGTARLAGLVIERERLLRERAEAQARALAALEANQHMDAFLGMVGHELKTPLTAVKMNLQLAKRRLATGLRESLATPLQQSLEGVQVLLDRAERQIGVQNRLVSDLLDSTRIQAGQLDLHLGPTDLAVIVREVVEDQPVAATPRVIEFALSALEAVPVLADADRIGQVVTNYLSNAIKYAPADRPIVVRLQVEGTNARLSVQDEGPGLSPTEQERIWGRFYRVPGVERQPGVGPSLGLGLYICRMIIEQHTGQVGVTSTLGHGSTFWFTLPLTAPDRVIPAADSN